jgi:signal transduction histidine kinase
VADLLADEALAARVILERSGKGGRASLDTESVRRALINLVRNAVQASPPEGTVDVRASVENGWARFEVTDDGPGVDEGQADRLFDAFVTNQAGGVGLGLALVRRVAEEHGGTVGLENRPGGDGAVARLQLPVAQAEGR